MKTIHTLSPQNVWKHFYSLTRIPRPSGHVEEVREFLVDFGKNIGLESFVDSIGNVIIRKPATPGMENRKGIILQGHMDMVPQKNNDKVHDFTKDPIETVVDGEWLKANGTTLGADNGLGVAAAMAVLEDKTLKHGPLEVLITTDEETGMVGAFGLQADTLQGEILLNLDSEDEGELYIGCAGGVDITATMQYKEEEVDQEDVAVRIDLGGLRGGHSGMEINQGRANANKLMVRVVREAILSFEGRLSSWDGGNMRNAIPREAHTVLTFPKENIDDFMGFIEVCEETFKEEFGLIEPQLKLSASTIDKPQFIVPEEIQDNLVSSIYAAHDGVLRMIPSVPDTVETSSNLAIVKIGKGEVSVQILARSSSDSMKEFLATNLLSCFSMAGMKVELSGSYSGWQPNVESPILIAMMDVYKEEFGVKPEIKVIHAGLECGIIGAVMPHLDMISFGPTLRSPHSPDERAHIPTVEKFYKFLVAALEKSPIK